MTDTDTLMVDGLMGAVEVNGPGRPLILCPSSAGDPTNDQGGGPNLAIRSPRVFLVAILYIHEYSYAHA